MTAKTAIGDMPTPAVEASNVRKAFGGVVALDGANFSAASGEVHALVGENGAGKSTLIKIIGGRLHADAGEVRIAGRKVVLSGPDAAHRLGAWTVFQELTLLTWMTVAENLFLGHEIRNSLGLIARGKLFSKAEQVLADVGIFHIDPRALVEDISLAERQLIEIVRAITQNPQILLLDEPTSSLVERETVWLFEQIRRLCKNGTSVVFTSHRWNEIRTIADRITVFRNGKDVGTFTELGEEEAVTLMTGTRVDVFFPPLPQAPQSQPALSVRELSGPRIKSVSFDLYKGEVLGMGGLAGHGHREVFFSLFGAEPHSAERIEMSGKPVRIRNPRGAVRQRIALVPEDRKTEGLLLPLSVRNNLTLTILRQLSRFGLVRVGEERRLAQTLVERLKIRARDLFVAVGALSGGNQQKVLLGRWLLAASDVLLLYDVTRGVDVATKHEIYELVLGLAREGHGILFYSSDAEELAHLCHRVLVMREGRIAAVLSQPGITAEQIVAAAMREHATV